jgi:hypothetical protein
MTVTREDLSGLKLAAKYLRDKESENWLGSKGHHTGYIAAAVDLERLAVEAQPAEPVQGEAVEVVGYLYKSHSGVYSQMPGREWEPLMTVAQHTRIIAAAKPDAELVELLRDAKAALDPFDDKLLEARIDAKLAEANKP